ncbi:MAG: FIVAR domain-containing protein, partial [Oscillospiraceae bacterium]|nr:FIVAR domain-containing protein [Oscillospiraceae bacterium]
MKRFSRIVAFILALCIVAAIMPAVNYVNAADEDADLWVDPVNGNDTNNGKNNTLVNNTAVANGAFASSTVKRTVTVNQQVDSSEEIEGTEVDLSGAFASSSNWTTAPSSVSGGVMTHGGYSAYTGQKFSQDSIFEFDLSIPIDETKEWVAFAIKAQKPGTMCVSGGTEYYVGFNTDDVEVQKFVNGQRTVIFGEVTGFNATYGVLPNNFFTPGSFHSIRVGAINVTDGVRFFMYVDGNLVFDITDFSNTITADGYFGVYGMTESISLRAFTDIQNTPNRTALDQALATAKKVKATDYTATSYQNLQTAIAEAEEILSAYGGVTQTMADEACAVITAALSNLERADGEQDPIQPPTEEPTEPTVPSGDGMQQI